MKLLRTSLGLFAISVLGCGSSGGGGGAASCADGGSCPPGYVCAPNGACLAQGTGGSGNSGGGGATGGTGAFGGATTGGFGGAGADGGSGGFGATGGSSGGSGGFGATGGSGGFGATGGSGGSGGSGCQDALYQKTCSQISSGIAACDTCAKSYCCSKLDPCLGNLNCAQGLYCALNFCASAPDPFNCMISTCQSCASSSLLLDVSSCLQTYCPNECPF